MVKSRAQRVAILLIGVLLLFVALVVFAVTSYVLRQRDSTLSDSLKRAEVLSSVFEDQLTQSLNLASLTLLALPESIDYPRHGSWATVAQLHSIEKLETLLRRLPFLRSVSIADSNGQILTSSNSENIGLQIDSRQYQPIDETEQNGILRIGPLIEGRDFSETHSLSAVGIPSTAISFFPALHTLEYGQNRLKAIAALNPDYFLNHISRHIDPKFFEVEVMSYDGLVLFSSSEGLAGGAAHYAAQTMQEMQATEIGTILEAYDDERQVMTAYRASRTYPLFVVVHADYETALAQWQEDTWFVSIVTAIAMGFLVLLSGALIVRLYKGMLDDEKRLEERQLAAKVFEQSTNGILITDAKRQMLAVNPKLEQVLGFSAAELIGQNPRLFSSGQHDRDFYRSMWQQIESNGYWQGEIQNRRKNGSLIEEHLTISRVIDAHGQLTNYLGVFEDISEQRMQERRLKRQIDAMRALNNIFATANPDPYESIRLALQVAVSHLHLDFGILSKIDVPENRYDIVVQSSPEGQLQDGQVFPLDKTYCAQTIASMDLLPIPNAPASAFKLHPCYTEFNLGAYLGMPVLVHGRPFGTINFSATQARDHDFDPSDSEFIRLLARWTGTFLERLRVQEELITARLAAESANIAKSRFLATMSHELRTPLNGVLGMAQLLQQGPLSESETQEFAGVIVSSGQQLLMLLNDILDLSKVEAGRLTLENGEVAPSVLLSEVETLFAENAHAKGLTLTSHWSGPAQATYRGDGHRIRQMLNNLVNNAIKFTAQGEVRIEATALVHDGQPAGIEIAVSDTGVGIPVEKQALLFQPFTQLDNSTTRQYGGTGLGLSIIKSLAELMSGQVGVDSTPQAGSRFWFRLPLPVISTAATPPTPDRKPTVLPASATAVSAVENPADGALMPASQGGRVLIVEDNPTNQWVIQSILKQMGVEAVTADNGQIAVDWVTSGEEVFAAIFMDVHMPVLDGHAATIQIRAWEAAQQRARVPIIGLTADAFADDRAQCLAVGMDDYLPKPVHIESLVAMLTKYSLLPSPSV